MKPRYRIALTGRFRTGKDTVAAMIADEIGGPCTPIAFAAALKQELADMVHAQLRDSLPALTKTEYWYTFDGWMKMHREVNGLGWQWWGEFRRRFYGEDYWINHPYLQETVSYWGASTHLIITDMRHHNEARWCRDNKFFMVRVEGPCRAKDEQRDPNHPSERHVEELPVDCLIQNTSDLVYLRENVKLMLDVMRAEIG